MKKTNLTSGKLASMLVLMLFAFFCGFDSVSAQASFTPDGLVSSDFVNANAAVQTIKTEVTNLENATNHSLGGFQEANASVRAAFLMQIADYIEQGLSVSSAIESARPAMVQMVNGIDIPGLDATAIFNDTVALLDL